MHVLVEKPLAASLADCDAMLAAARESGIKLGVISQRRWYEPVLRMKAAIDAGKIGRPVLGVFMMYSWRDPSYYQSDPWRGRWDTEGGGVLVNQSPHMLDLLAVADGRRVAEVSGYWANLNHPSVEVEDTPSRSSGSRTAAWARSSPACRRSRGSTPRCTFTGQTARPSASRPTAARPSSPACRRSPSRPLNDLWTIPGEEDRLARFQAEDRARFRGDRRREPLPCAPDRRLPPRDHRGSPPLVTGEDGRGVVAIFQAIYQSNREGRSIKLGLRSR